MFPPRIYCLHSCNQPAAVLECCRVARTSNCAQNATSVACMACSQELPPSAVAHGVAPIGMSSKQQPESTSLLEAPLNT